MLWVSLFLCLASCRRRNRREDLSRVAEAALGDAIDALLEKKMRDLEARSRLAKAREVSDSSRRTRLYDLFPVDDQNQMNFPGNAAIDRPPRSKHNAAIVRPPRGKHNAAIVRPPRLRRRQHHRH